MRLDFSNERVRPVVAHPDDAELLCAGTPARVMLQQCRTRGAQAGVEAAEAFQAHRAWKRARAW